MESALDKLLKVLSQPEIIAAIILGAATIAGAVIMRNRQRQISPHRSDPGNTRDTLKPSDITHTHGKSATIYIAEFESPPNVTLFGRDDALKSLTKAWKNENAGVLNIYGFGGIGKSALVDSWMRKNLAFVEYIFAWTFKISDDPELAGSGKFLDRLTNWLSANNLLDKDGLPSDPGIKLSKIIDVIRSRKALLILDGLEALQSLDPNVGRIEDPLVSELIRSLAIHNAGLCLATSRYEITGIHDVNNIELDRLSKEAAVDLMQHLGVNVNIRRDEVDEAIEENGGNALAITLLSTCLVELSDGDIRTRRDIQSSLSVVADNSVQHKHIEEIIDFYTKKIAASTNPVIRRAGRVLNVLGLFEVAVKDSIVRKLRESPITGLTDDPFAPDSMIEDGDWKDAVSWLRKVRLLYSPQTETSDAIDAHRIVRRFFHPPEQLSDETLQAHKRLFDHFSGDLVASPKSVSDMSNALDAVRHGCLAGMEDKAFEVYMSHVRLEPRDKKANGFDLRANVHSIVKQHGAVSTDLVALSYFFAKPWNTVKIGKGESPTNKETAYKAYILLYTGLNLRLLGRNDEAVSVLGNSLSVYESISNQHGIATASRHLGQLKLILGDLQGAEEYCQQAKTNTEVEDADPKAMVDALSACAHVFHQQGKYSQARHLYEEAKCIQGKNFPNEPLLWGIPAYRYCGFLIDTNKAGLALVHTRRIESYSNMESYMLGKQLINLTQTKALMALGDSSAATTTQLEITVAGLRKTNQQQYVIQSLLTQASLFANHGNMLSAWANIGEAFDLATSSEMSLAQADVFLVSAYSHLTIGQLREARASLRATDRLVDACHYVRRRESIESLRKHCSGGRSYCRAKFRCLWHQLTSSGDTSITRLAKTDSAVFTIEVQVKKSKLKGALEPRNLEQFLETCCPEPWYKSGASISIEDNIFVIRGEPLQLAKIVVALTDNTREVHVHLGASAVAYEHRGRWYILDCDG